MDGMRFVGFVVTLLAGGAMLVVIFEFLNTERHHAREQRRRSANVEPAVRSVTALPAFFARPSAADYPAISGFDDALVAFLESHVKAERAMASKFVHFPSVDSLYRQAHQSSPMQ